VRHAVREGPAEEDSYTSVLVGRVVGRTVRAGSPIERDASEPILGGCAARHGEADTSPAEDPDAILPRRHLGDLAIDRALEQHPIPETLDGAIVDAHIRLALHEDAIS